MEHYDWNDGWLFTPVFDPAIVRPECPELTLEPVRLPHTEIGRASCRERV